MEFLDDERVGLPHAFTQGQFAGQTIRMSLEILQEPTIACKLSPSSRRQSVLPPLVALLQIFVLSDSGLETEIADYNDVDIAGMICSVEIFSAYSDPSTQDTSPHKRLATSLLGSTWQQPHRIIWREKASLMFVFSDLTTTAALGEHFFRLRMFDRAIPLPPGVMGRPIYAQALGANFGVVSAKAFPGVSPSTDLERLLFHSGVKLRIIDA